MVYVHGYFTVSGTISQRFLIFYDKWQQLGNCTCRNTSIGNNATGKYRLTNFESTVNGTA